MQTKAIVKNQARNSLVTFVIEATNSLPIAGVNINEKKIEGYNKT